MDRENKPELLQAELNKHLILLRATLDYHLEHYTGSIVFDDWDPAAEFYMREKDQTGQDFQNHNLEKLQERLTKFLTRLRDRADFNFERYIKEQTGYEIDIFETTLYDAENIIKKGKISNNDELHTAGIIIQAYQSKTEKKDLIDKLITLSNNFDKQDKPEKVNSDSTLIQIQSVVIQPPSPESNHKEKESTVSTPKKLSESDFVEFKRKNGLLSEIRSPDNKRFIMITTNGADTNALTNVSIVLKGGSGGIYSARGASLPIKAYWKDNTTIIIETKKEYTVESRCTKVRSFEDLIKIEYIESKL